jgi:hypothetical protein
MEPVAAACALEPEAAARAEARAHFMNRRKHADSDQPQQNRPG